MEQAIEGAEPLHRVKRGRPAKAAAIETPVVGESASQAYAMRVWNGQSVDVPRAERIARCMNALRGQNLPTDGIVFPA
jgi:hypothetical protein